MEDSCDSRCWDEMIPDVLGLIFKFISVQEVFTVIPSVCKGWKRASMGPYCWQDLDFQEWSQSWKPKNFEKMLRILIHRSSGFLRRLRISGLQDDRILAFIADHAKYLTTLELPQSSISNSMMKHVAEPLSNITTLDVSYCANIKWSALESIGKHCKNLKVLRRNMLDLIFRDDEALAIASTMPNLVHLELTYLSITTDAVLNILGSCKYLQVLDLRWCWMVKLDEVSMNKFRRVKVLGPFYHDSSYGFSGLTFHD